MQPESREILLRPTIAMNIGESKVAQCAHCGCLAVWSVSDGRTLANCPACDRIEWMGKTLEVGPFVIGFSDSDRRIANQVLEQARRQEAAEESEIDWRDIFIDRAWEALDATDPRYLRAQLVQCAAVIMNWIDSIDRQAK